MANWIYTFLPLQTLASNIDSQILSKLTTLVYGMLYWVSNYGTQQVNNANYLRNEKYLPIQIKVDTMPGGGPHMVNSYYNLVN